MEGVGEQLPALTTGFGAPLLVSDRSAGGAVTRVWVMPAPQPLVDGSCRRPRRSWHTTSRSRRWAG